MEDVRWLRVSDWERLRGEAEKAVREAEKMHEDDAYRRLGRVIDIADNFGMSCNIARHPDGWLMLQIGSRRGEDVAVATFTLTPSVRVIEARSGPKLSSAPGSKLIHLADLLYSRKSMDEVLQPAIDDMRTEYFDALAVGRPGKARWVRVRGTWAFLSAAALLTMASVGKTVVKVWKLIG